jgi:hypothetical protein
MVAVVSLSLQYDQFLVCDGDRIDTLVLCFSITYYDFSRSVLFFAFLLQETVGLFENPTPRHDFLMRLLNQSKVIKIKRHFPDSIFTK